MTQYFIRRFLLMIPTFFGATLVVFIILQLAPGGPLEQAVMRIKAGAAQNGEFAGGGGAVKRASDRKSRLKRWRR